jgi:cytochrome c
VIAFLRTLSDSPKPLPVVEKKTETPKPDEKKPEPQKTDEKKPEPPKAEPGKTEPEKPATPCHASARDSCNAGHSGAGHAARRREEELTALRARRPACRP